MILILLLFSLWRCNSAQTVPRLEPNNWTTCEEFLSNSSHLDVSSLFDIDWKIFYFWNNVQDESYIVRFNKANPLLVDRFKVEMKDTNDSIDWNDAVMFMETAIDFSALYLKTEIPGKFRLIPTTIFQKETIDMLIFGLKLVPPGYLGIMNCQFRLCYALAPVDKMPEDNNILSSALTMGFSGESNYSYLTQTDTRKPSPYLEDDVEEDEQMEVDSEMFNLDDN